MLTASFSPPAAVFLVPAGCDSREILESRLGQDPFQQLGLAHTEIIPFEASMASPALQSLL